MNRKQWRKIILFWNQHDYLPDELSYLRTKCMIHAAEYNRVDELIRPMTRISARRKIARTREYHIRGYYAQVIPWVHPFFQS